MLQTEVTDETRSVPCPADLVLSRTLEQTAGRAGDTRRQHGVRIGAAAIRSRDRRARPCPDRTADRARARTDETLPRNGRRIARQCHEVQSLLHLVEAF